ARARAGRRDARSAQHARHQPAPAPAALLPAQPPVPVARPRPRRNTQLRRARTAVGGVRGTAPADARTQGRRRPALRARHRARPRRLAGRVARAGAAAPGLAHLQRGLRVVSAGRLSRRILPPLAVVVLLAAALVLANDAAGGSSRFAALYSWILGASAL